MGKTEKYDHMKLIREYAGGHKKLITIGRCLAAENETAIQEALSRLIKNKNKCLYA